MDRATPTPPANAYTTARLLLWSFLGTILLGAVLLHLPLSRHSEPVLVSWIDALFTATSAVCVTGLSVVDTGTTFSATGQGVILLLIQVGGLGILTFSTFFITRLRSRRSGVEISQRLLVETAHGQLAQIPPHRLLGIILVFTLVAELVGTLMLWQRFAQDFPGAEALWMAVFHAVSAFCNAGFGLLEDNLMRYRGDWGVNGAIMGLIVLGGLGFVVVADLLGHLKTRLAGTPRRLSLHSRLVLRTSLLLILLGCGTILLAEWGNPRAMGTTAEAKLLESLFLSVTSRTAGFNTVAMDQLTNTTLLLVIVLMFIGGSPGSTAGGIKTTTLAVCHALLRSRARNRPKVECLQRSLSDETVSRAVWIVTGYLLVTACGFFLLQLSEGGGRSFQETTGNPFLAYLFETVSALGTVGLSTGLTPSLSAAGKGVLIALMFIGRLGPLLVATVLLGETRQVRYSYPEEPVNLG
ncbi:MAG: potassium transporter TrkH [Magnetococcales bacterium]|nr:potassium transporter TrkH [Magnetococcales bacterium]